MSIILSGLSWSIDGHALSPITMTQKSDPAARFTNR